MLLTPRYEGPELLRLALPLGDPSVPLLRQRRRLAALLADLDADAWAAPSRCAGWTVRDVVAHLVTVDQFWTLSVASARAGEPTRFLARFDPVATPAALVDGMAQPPEELRAAFADGVEAFAAALDGLDEAGWAAPAEAPPGHVALAALAGHALWDAWVHERDIALPLGLAPAEEADEVAAALAYAAALSPTFLATMGSERAGALAVAGTGPDVHVVVEAGATVVVHDGPAPDGALHLAGPSVALLEGLSLRAPLPCPVPDEHRWLVAGLSEVFDQ